MKTLRPVVIKDLGRTQYEPVLQAMQAFTAERDTETLDELWFTEHESVFTQGQAGKAEHVLASGDIPIVQSDRGGQVTYHGPGQITAYLLFDLRRLKIGVRDLVTGIEVAMAKTVALYGIPAEPRADAPGIYVRGDKIGSLGLRVRHGCAYHGLSLNVDMDLEPFSRINPCGLFGVQVTDMAHFGDVDIERVKTQLTEVLLSQYGLSCHIPNSQHVGSI